MEKKINKKIKLITTNIYKVRKEDLFKSNEEEIVILENIRFYKEEETNNENFAKHISSFADLYVNDAFSCSHRQHASVCNITKYLPSYAGLQFETEIQALKKITSNINKPISCIIGGSKISTKIGLIKNLINKFDNLIFVGGMANNIINFKGHSIGKSLIEKNCINIIKELFEIADKCSCSIYYPEDVCVGNDLSSFSKTKKLDEVSNEEMILDIGPKTI